MGRKRDYYEVLGVSRIASTAEIRRAFRRLAREIHPDINPHPDATRQFQELNDAYQVLSNPVRRSVYDRTGFHPGTRRPQPPPYQSSRPPPPRRPPPPPPPRPNQQTWQQNQSSSQSTGYSRTTWNPPPESQSASYPPLTVLAALFKDAVKVLSSGRTAYMPFLMVTIVPCAQASLIYQFALANHITWLQVDSNALWLALLIEAAEIVLVTGFVILRRIKKSRSSAQS